MPNVTRSRRRVGAIVMAAGAIFFALSLAITALAYVNTFGEIPSAWNTAAGLHAAFIDSLLFGVFAAHHSIFARTNVRQRVAAIVSTDLERPVYVLAAAVLLLLVVGLWIPVPGLAWETSGSVSLLMIAVQAAGVGVTLAAARQLGIKRLSGLTPPQAASDPSPPLRSTGLYGFVRHPIYFAWVIMVWPTPYMTGSRLTFASVTTLYLAIAVVFEERTLRQQFGAAYDDYKRIVRWRMVPGLY